MIALGWQLLVLPCVLLALGAGLGQLGRFALPQRITFVFEIAVQNSALGLAIGALAWRGAPGFPIYATPAAVYGSLTLLLPLVALLSRTAGLAASAKH